MTGALPRLAECRDCHDPIRFVRLPSGKAMPVNPQPAPAGEGNIAAHVDPAGQLVGFVISRDRRPGLVDTLRFTVHAATCEARERPTPREPDTPLF